MKKFLVLASLICFICLPVSAEIYSPHKQTSMSEETYGTIRRLSFDMRQYTNGVIPQEDVDVLEEHTTANFIYLYTYRAEAALNPIPDYLMSRRIQYHLQWDWTGATALPDAPVDTTQAENVDNLFYYQSFSVATAMGGTTIADVPTSWRRYRGLYRIVFERNRLTEAQQLGILDGIEREIDAGLGKDYFSNNANVRQIDFQHNSTPNDPITKIELQNRGWVDVSATQSEKFFNDSNGVSRRWTIYHNS